MSIMKRITTAILCASMAIAAWAGTPTIDGSFDGESVWGTPVATNSTPGFVEAGATATDLYVTDDANYVYFGAAVTGLDEVMYFGFAIDCRLGGANSQEPGQQKINFAFPVGGGFDEPDVVVRGNCTEVEESQIFNIHQWNGFFWTTTQVGPSEVRPSPSNGFIECRVAKTVLSMRASKQGRVQFYLSGNDSGHGLFTSVPYDMPCEEWFPDSPQLLTNPAQPVSLPVHVSAFTLE